MNESEYPPMREGTEGEQNHSPLQEAAVSLLQPSDSPVNFNEIADIIRRTKKSPSSDALAASDTHIVVVNDDLPPDEAAVTSSMDKLISACKALLPYPILVSRFSTCAYRSLPNADAFIMMTDTIPGLESWRGSRNLTITADTIGAFFALTDAIQTISAGKEKVFELCEHPNWLSRGKNFARSVCAGNYPIPFLVLFLLSVLPGSFIKGQVGLTDTIQRLDVLAGTQLSHQTISAIVLPITLLSCICSSTFLFQKSAWVVRAFKELEGNPAWDQFRSENKAWMRKINIIGASQATVGAFATGIAIFYNHHKFQFELQSLIFFLLVGVTSVCFNYRYCYNPVYLLESILEKQHIEAKKQAPDQVTTSQSNERSCCLMIGNVNGFFSVAGGAIIQSPAFVRSLQVLLIGLTLATGDERFKSTSENPYFLMPATLISLLFVWGAFVQGRAMWASPSEKKSHVDTHQPAFRSTPVLA